MTTAQVDPVFAAGRCAERIRQALDPSCPACGTFADLAEACGETPGPCPMCGGTGLLPVAGEALFRIADVAALVAIAEAGHR